jgi:hypothetical protein
MSGEYGCVMKTTIVQEWMPIDAAVVGCDVAICGELV